MSGLADVRGGLAPPPGVLAGLALDLGLGAPHGLDHAQNLLSGPNNFGGDPAWDTTQNIVLAGGFTDPQGDPFAWSMMDNATNSDHAIQQNIGTLGPEGQLCTAELFIQQNTGRYFCVGLGANAIGAGVCVDTTTGAIVEQIAAGGATLVGADVRKMGATSWYRVRVAGKTPGIVNVFTAALSNSAAPGVLAPLYAGTGSAINIYFARFSWGGA